MFSFKRVRCKLQRRSEYAYVLLLLLCRWENMRGHQGVHEAYNATPEMMGKYNGPRYDEHGSPLRDCCSAPVYVSPVIYVELQRTTAGGD